MSFQGEYDDVLKTIKDMPARDCNPSYTLVMKFSHDDEIWPLTMPSTEGWTCDTTAGGMQYFEVTCHKTVKPDWFGRFK